MEELRLQLEDVLNGAPPPVDWVKATIWPIHKKGDPMIVANYRGIAIGNAIQKLLASIINHRLQQFVEENHILPDTQNGFRQKRSTVDNLYILNAAISVTTSRPKGKLFAFFVDFTTAFDTVNRRILWTIMERKGIPIEIINVIQQMYSSTAYEVGGQEFNSHMGVKQGCPLSPLLFAIYIADLDTLLQRNQLGGMVIGKKKLYSLAFADDLAILAENASELKDMMKAMHRFAAGRELTINENKSKIMMFRRSGRGSGERTWTVDGRTYEEVSHFRYLGVTLQRSGKYTKHREQTAIQVNKRTTEVWSLGERLFKNNFQIRMQMFQTLVTPIMTYASEVTGYEQPEEFERIQRRYARWLLGLPNGTCKDILDSEAGLQSIADHMTLRATKYEWSLNHKDSELLAEANAALQNTGSHSIWGEQKRDRFNRLGWGESAARELLRSPSGYF